jgi:hypothetical protein
MAARKRAMLSGQWGLVCRSCGSVVAWKDSFSRRSNREPNHEIAAEEKYYLSLCNFRKRTEMRVQYVCLQRVRKTSE